MTGVVTIASRSVRVSGLPPKSVVVAADDLVAAATRQIAEVKHRHRLTGVVAPPELHDTLGSALSAVGLHTVDHVHELADDDVPVFGPEAVKGLEFDGVVVLNPAALLDGSERGARLLYVAMTRAVQELWFVSDVALPEPLEV